MTKVAIPSSTQSLIDKDQKADVSWFTYFQDVWQAIRGGLGISLGGTVYVNTQSASNVGAAETDLMSYTIAGKMLTNDGDKICVKGWGNFAANGNSKIIRVKFGSQMIYTTDSNVASDSTWEVVATIIRRSATTQEIIVQMLSNDSTLQDDPEYPVFRTAGTQDLTLSNVIKITGEGSASGDVTEHAIGVDFTPNT